MEKELTALRKEIAALRCSIDRLVRKLAVYCAPAKGASDEAEWTDEEPEEEESSCIE